MILDAIIGVVVTALTGLIGLMPSYSLPGSMEDFGSGLGSALAGANGVFPIVTLGVCIGIVIAARVFLFAWALLVFVWELIPFKAT